MKPIRFAIAALLLASCSGETPRAETQKHAGAIDVAKSDTLAETRVTTGTVRSANVSRSRRR